MSYWYYEFNAVFFITIISIISGCISLILRYCLKSRCTNFKCCWGLIDIKKNNNDIEEGKVPEVPEEVLEVPKLPELPEIQSNNDSILSISSLNVCHDNFNV